VDRSVSILAILPLLLRGFGVTLLLTVLSLGIGTVFGTLLGCLYAWGGRVLRAVLFVFVTAVRGVPLVVQVFAVFFVLPAYGIKFSAVTSAAIALSLFASFTIMEIVRAASRQCPESSSNALSLSFSSQAPCGRWYCRKRSGHDASAREQAVFMIRRPRLFHCSASPSSYTSPRSRLSEH
jgi:His/Glu/Gln/Arg/opine family amino acid ABC transporter permease subunit